MISDTNNTSSSEPIAAVRQTIVEILAQHRKEKQTDKHTFEIKSWFKITKSYLIKNYRR